MIGLLLLAITQTSTGAGAAIFSVEVEGKQNPEMRLYSAFDATESFGVFGHVHLEGVSSRVVGGARWTPSPNLSLELGAGMVGAQNPFMLGAYLRAGEERFGTVDVFFEAGESVLWWEVVTEANVFSWSGVGFIWRRSDGIGPRFFLQITDVRCGFLRANFKGYFDLFLAPDFGAAPRPLATGGLMLTFVRM